MSKKYLTFILTILWLFILPGCSSNKSFMKKYGDITPVTSRVNSKVDGWQNYYFSKTDCNCVYGDEFYIALKETPSQSNNLMISLQGGGACWPGMIHCKPNTSEEDVLISDFTTQLDDRLTEDWNQVVIPYCDGSVFMGDTKQDYNDDDKTDHWHNGLKNSVAALKLTHKKFPNTSKIFLTGCSAGGYGTILHLRLLRELYPKAAIYVLNESGPGLLKPDNEFWEMVDASWNLSQLLPKNCDPCAGQLIYWYDDMLKDPGIKIGLYSSYMDQVIGRDFLKMTPENYKSLLVKTTDDLNAKYPDQFKRFFIKGKSHCVRNRDYQVNGIKYWDWVMAFINEKENWKDILE
ncbi:hypothetical protein P278_03830 [Zhouia amylolytica AD3]|uniref:Pectinacetylesterase n=2 Tax=Zhouia amylolytica TaxID=376730 RepID=W2UUD3_9FLAO|nr:hypothetical protein P278_03830 [Zhouia amylolytica AD3]